MIRLEPAPLHPSLAQGEEIERRQGLTSAAFMADYAFRNKPVIVSDAMESCRALNRWTPEFFQERYGAISLNFLYGNVTLLMRDFIPRVLTSSPENPAPYWTNAPVQDYFPELLEDIQPLPPYFRPNWASRSFVHPGLRTALNRGAQVEIYIGGPGGKFPVLHWDGLATHAFLVQIYGLKQYWIWPPTEDALLYRTKDAANLSAIPNVEEPDLEKYPLFALARATTFVLRPGELLFVPSRWWHTAKILSPSITISTNTLNRSNWRLFTTSLLDGLAGPRRLVKAGYLSAERARHGISDLLGAA